MKIIAAVVYPHDDDHHRRNRTLVERTRVERLHVRAKHPLCGLEQKLVNNDAMNAVCHLMCRFGRNLYSEKNISVMKQKAID